MKDGKGSDAASMRARYVTLNPGDLARLSETQSGRRGEPAYTVRVLAGTLWLSYGGNDTVLWRGEEAHLEPRSARDARIWGPTLASPLGRSTVVVELSEDRDQRTAGRGRETTGWRTRLFPQDGAALPLMKAAIVALVGTTWKHWRAKSGGRQSAAANPCASTFS